MTEVMAGGYERCRLRDQEQIRIGRSLWGWASPVGSPPAPHPLACGLGCVAWMALDKGTSKMTCFVRVCEQCSAEGPGMHQRKACPRPALMGRAQSAP